MLKFANAAGYFCVYLKNTSVDYYLTPDSPNTEILFLNSVKQWFRRLEIKMQIHAKLFATSNLEGSTRVETQTY